MEESRSTINPGKGHQNQSRQNWFKRNWNINHVVQPFANDDIIPVGSTNNGEQFHEKCHPSQSSSLFAGEIICRAVRLREAKQDVLYHGDCWLHQLYIKESSWGQPIPIHWRKHDVVQGEMVIETIHATETSQTGNKNPDALRSPFSTCMTYLWSHYLCGKGRTEHRFHPLENVLCWNKWKQPSRPLSLFRLILILLAYNQKEHWWFFYWTRVSSGNY